MRCERISRIAWTRPVLTVPFRPLCSSAPRVCSAAALIFGNSIRPRAGVSLPLHQILDALDGFPKPVVAAIQGFALGGGLELALACHYRVADKSARVGLPEVKIGLLPGAGGTQRLPRVIGVEKAADLVVSGDMVGGDKLVALGICSELLDGDFLEGACAFAAKMAATGERPRVRDLNVTAVEDGFFEARRQEIAKRWRGYPAAAACLACIEAAATMDFDDGLAFERAEFQKLLASPGICCVAPCLLCRTPMFQDTGRAPRDC